MTFTGRVVAGMLAVLLVTVGMLLWAADTSLRRELEGVVAATLRREALVVRAGLPSDPVPAQAWIHRVAQETGYRITVITLDGTVVGESDYATLPLPPIDNHADRPEVRAALADSGGAARRRSETVGRPMMYVAVPGGPGVVRVAADLEYMNGIVRRAQVAVGLAALLALLVGVLVASLVARSVTRPVVAVTEAARAMAAGEPPRFPHSRLRDINGLVQAMRQTHQELGTRFLALQQEQAESAALVASMAEGVIAADGRDHVTVANPAARRLLGYDDGAALPDLAHLFRGRHAREAVRLVAEGRPVDGIEVELEGRHVVLTGRPLPHGGAILVLHDQTEIRRLETVRRDFVANVSHELKTPLTSVAGYAETLLADRPDPEVERKFLNTILSNARRMQRLVDDLLDLARIESGRWQPSREPVDVAGAAAAAWRDLADRAAALGVRMTTQIGPAAQTVQADPESVALVLRNLLDNAIRYTPSGGTVTVSSRAEEGGVVLEVADTGSGISREHLGRVFERFYRVDPSRSRAEGGTGLGLAIVRRAVEAHGGAVAIASEPGEGTRVTCWFPAPPVTDS